MKIKVMSLLLAALLLIPAGVMFAEEAEALPQGIEEAAEEMGLGLAQARQILEQARELRQRAHGQCIGSQEALQRREQKREELQQRLEQRQEELVHRMEQRRESLQRRVEVFKNLNISRMLPGCRYLPANDN